MAKGYNATEYMYSSARLRALETKIIGRDEIFRLCDSDGIESVISVLSDHGFDIIRGENGDFLREETLMGGLKKRLDDVLGMECGFAVSFLQYQYDCNNIKAIIKCNARSISPDEMLLPLGTVEIKDAKEAFVNKNYSVYPEAMAVAIPAAEEAFAATGNPQKIDFIIDRACFADMITAAKATRVELAERLVRARIDLVNIMQAVRVHKMKLGAQASAVLNEVYIEGGSFDADSLSLVLTDTDGFIGEIMCTDYYPLAQMIIEDSPLGDLERKVDNIYMDIASKAKQVPFGLEIAIGYVVALEYEIKNVRLLLASKAAGLSSDVIRERLRDCYV